MSRVHTESCPAGHQSLAQRALLAPIRVYQGLRSGHGSPCRYTPSCSEYAAQAINQHGSFKGVLLAVKRLGRCHPWGGFGYDPVPARNVNAASQGEI